jgi:hypothetical protein
MQVSKGKRRHGVAFLFSCNASRRVRECFQTYARISAILENPHSLAGLRCVVAVIRLVVKSSLHNCAIRTQLCNCAFWTVLLTMMRIVDDSSKRGLCTVADELRLYFSFGVDICIQIFMRLHFVKSECFHVPAYHQSAVTYLYTGPSTPRRKSF